MTTVNDESVLFWRAGSCGRESDAIRTESPDSPIRMRNQAFANERRVREAMAKAQIE